MVAPGVSHSSAISRTMSGGKGKLAKSKPAKMTRAQKAKAKKKKKK